MQLREIFGTKSAPDSLIEATKLAFARKGTKLTRVYRRVTNNEENIHDIVHPKRRFVARRATEPSVDYRMSLKKPEITRDPLSLKAQKRHLKGESDD